MTIPIQSSSEFLCQQLVELIESLQESEAAGEYSQLVEFGFAELVREQLRALAQEGSERGERQLLEGAINQAVELVQKRLPESSFEITPYAQQQRQALKYPAREMAQLSERLTEAKGRETTATATRGAEHSRRNPI
jgi:hypothetical protein